jgi:hypothetical protein
VANRWEFVAGQQSALPLHRVRFEARSQVHPMTGSGRDTNRSGSSPMSSMTIIYETELCSTLSGNVSRSWLINAYFGHSAFGELRRTLRLPLDTEILVDEQYQCHKCRGSNMAYGAH